MTAAKTEPSRSRPEPGGSAHQCTNWKFVLRQGTCRPAMPTIQGAVSVPPSFVPQSFLHETWHHPAPPDAGGTLCRTAGWRRCGTTQARGHTRPGAHSSQAGCLCHFLTDPVAEPAASFTCSSSADGVSQGQQGQESARRSWPAEFKEPPPAEEEYEEEKEVNAPVATHGREPTPHRQAACATF